MLNQEIISAMKKSIKTGVSFQVAPQLFETPSELSNRMAEMLDISPSDRILEPEAGKGSLIRACENSNEITAIEINYQLCNYLRASYPEAKVICDDFLKLSPEALGEYDKILMNPPFADSQDIEHITHAFKILKKGGVLVAIACEGPFFRQDKKSTSFRDFLKSQNAEVIQLPEGSFKESGTMVRTRLIKIEKD